MCPSVHIGIGLYMYRYMDTRNPFKLALRPKSSITQVNVCAARWGQATLSANWTFMDAVFWTAERKAFGLRVQGPGFRV